MDTPAARILFCVTIKYHSVELVSFLGATLYIISSSTINIADRTRWQNTNSTCPQIAGEDMFYFLRKQQFIIWYPLKFLINKEKYLKINVSIMNFMNYHTDAKGVTAIRQLSQLKVFRYLLDLFLHQNKQFFLSTFGVTTAINYRLNIHIYEKYAFLSEPLSVVFVNMTVWALGVSR